MRSRYTLFSVVTAVFVVLDQITKLWVVENIEYRREEIEVIPGFFSLVHAQNSGAAMGMLSTFEHRMLLFAVFTLIAMGVLIHMVWQLRDDDRFLVVVLGLIASGAVGNAIDRVHKQSVTDFLRVYTEHPKARAWLIDTVGTNEWPSFNVADSAIVVGLILFMIQSFFVETDEEDMKPDPPAKPLSDFPGQSE